MLSGRTKKQTEMKVPGAFLQARKTYLQIWDTSLEVQVSDLIARKTSL